MELTSWLNTLIIFNCSVAQNNYYFSCDCFVKKFRIKLFQAVLIKYIG